MGGVVDPADEAWGKYCEGDYVEGYATFVAGYHSRDAEIQKLRMALQSYANLPDGRYHGPDDIYEDLGDTARAALAVADRPEIPDDSKGQK